MMYREERTIPKDVTVKVIPASDGRGIWISMINKDGKQVGVFGVNMVKKYIKYVPPQALGRGQCKYLTEPGILEYDEEKHILIKTVEIQDNE